MRARAIIHLDRFSQNIAFVKELTGKPVCVPVKANGYGHGVIEIAGTALESGAYCLGVATVSEGTELRKSGIACPILLFSQSHPAEIPALIKAKLTPFVSDILYADNLNAEAASQSAKIAVHIKIDTGMRRLGCQGETPEEALSLAKHIRACSCLKLEGVATHFAVSDSEADVPANDENRAFTQLQISRFKEAVSAIRDEGIDPGIVHAANSGAVLQYPEAWFDMVRPGILLYGYAIPKKTDAAAISSGHTQIRPVMELRTVISLIKKIKKGESVSYGRTWTAPHDTNIALLSIGYGDGFPRMASNKWQAVINGITYPLVGRICMDQCCADLGADGGNGNVKQWDEAVLFGGEAPDAGELAAVTGTIPYEITCNINNRVERIY